VNRSHERDEKVERLLRQSLRAPRQGSTDACLDGETMAAWMDDGLRGAALDQAQAHVADCARCQALLRDLVRIEPAAPPEEPARRRWLMWLVPLTAAATAVAIWVAIPEERRAQLPPPAAEQSTPPDAAPTELRRDVQPAAPAPERAKKTAEQTVAPSARSRSETPLKPGPAVKEEQSKTRTTLDESVQDQAAAPPRAAPPAAAQEPSAPASTLAKDQLAAFAAAGGIVILSPDPMVRWRVQGVLIQRSTNGGAAWNPVMTAPAELAAGSAPSPAVCWLVGRNGLVLRSIDGTSFSRVLFPEAIDLTTVRAADAQTASVTGRDGRVFETTDGGLTWRPR
jgi:hypothetical protein